MKYVVDAAKERWICKVAEEAERLKTDSRGRWTSIQQLQMTYAGRRPTRYPAIQKENAEITRSSEEVKARWFEHFNRVLNVPSEFHLRNVFNTSTNNLMDLTHNMLSCVFLALLFYNGSTTSCF